MKLNALVRVVKDLFSEYLTYILTLLEVNEDVFFLNIEEVKNAVEREKEGVRTINYTETGVRNSVRSFTFVPTRCLLDGTS